MYHSIIVGFGLAGLCYALQLKKRGKAFLIIDHPSTKGASRITSGLCNPFNFKRLTLAWRAPEFFSYAKEFFHNHEKQIKVPIIQQMPIYKKLNSIGELNQWSIQCDQPFFNLFFSNQILKNFNNQSSRGIGYGVAYNTFQIDLEMIFETFLQTMGASSYVQEAFNLRALNLDDSKVKYKHWTAQHIVFCQGYGLKSNPLTQHLPLVGNKGEILVITTDTMPKNKILKSKVYVIPQTHKNYFWVGATYDRHSKSTHPTSTSKQNLMDGLKQSLEFDYQIIKHQAQIRPTMIDRRPLLGKIAHQTRAYLFNGLGTRGIMMAPLLSNWLYQHIEKSAELPKEVSIDRFNEYELIKSSNKM